MDKDPTVHDDAVQPRADAPSAYEHAAPVRKKIWNFVWLNALSIGAMLALFYAVLYGDFLTGSFRAAWEWLARHPVILALTASAPFFAALLVGRASSARAKRKRAQAEAARQGDDAS